MAPSKVAVSMRKRKSESWLMYLPMPQTLIEKVVLICTQAGTPVKAAEQVALKYQVS